MKISENEQTCYRVPEVATRERGVSPLSSLTLAMWMVVMILLLSLNACGGDDAAEDMAGDKQIRPMIAKAFKYIKEKNYERALIQTQELLNRDKSDAEAWAVQGIIHLGQDRLKDAEFDGKEAVKLDPSLAIPYGVLAEACYRTSRFDQAIEWARKGLERDTHLVTAYRIIGNVYLRKGKVQDGIAVLNRGVLLDPEHAGLRVLLASGYLKTKDYDKALEQLKQALELEPELPGAHFNIAQAYDGLKEGEMAMRHMDKAEALYRVEGKTDSKKWINICRNTKRILAKKYRMRPEDI